MTQKKAKKTVASRRKRRRSRQTAERDCASLWSRHLSRRTVPRCKCARLFTKHIKQREAEYDKTEDDNFLTREVAGSPHLGLVGGHSSRCGRGGVLHEEEESRVEMARATDDGFERYKKWHWGNPAREVKDIDEPHLGDDVRLIEAGLLTELACRSESRALRFRWCLWTSMTKEAARMGNEPQDLGVIAVDPSDYNENHLGFDMDHPHERLYIHLSPSSRKDAARYLWRKGEPSYSLYELAGAVGGHHADKDDYPDVRVQPVGVLFYVTYYTLKEEEGDTPSPSKYIHRMGEEGGVEPILAVSQDGRLWIAGGTYSCPYPGITQ